MIDDIKNLVKGKFVGITGGAGSGKTMLSKMLGFSTYHIDNSFFGDSKYRMEILERKSEFIDSFIDSCNMYNWWNWDEVENTINNERRKYETFLVEGALLGTEWLLSQFDFILFLFDSPQNRFNKIIIRDSYKRNFYEAIERFLITEYSETLYYKNMFQKFLGKIIVIDTNYNFLYYEPTFYLSLSLPLMVKI